MDRLLNEKQTAVQFSNVSKKYTLGEISGATLREELYARLFRSAAAPAISETSPKEIYALKDINLTIHQGETLGIIGRNGAGKSTLLKLLSRITTPSEGEIDINGRVASMLEVGTGFHGDLTGRENIFINGAIMGMSRAEIRSKIDDIITFSELEAFIDTPVKRYSSGMYVKLGFAVAAHLDSEIVVMDEVLAVGDSKFQQKCLDKMRSLAQDEGRTVLYVSHNMNTIRSLCDRCIVLSQGQLVFDGAVNDAIAHYLYLGDNDGMKTYYLYDEASRPYIRTPQQADDFHLLDLTVLESGAPVYHVADQPLLKLRFSTETFRENVCFRFEVWHQDGTKIGSMLTADTIDFTPGEHSVLLRPDLTHLTEGQYRADLVACQILSNGEEYTLDRVYPGLIFAVKSVEGTNPFRIWKNQYWGDIHLHDMRLERIEKV